MSHGLFLRLRLELRLNWGSCFLADEADGRNVICQFVRNARRGWAPGGGGGGEGQELRGVAGKPPLCSRAARAPRGLGLGFWFVSCAHPPGSVGNRTPEFYFLMQREAELNENSEMEPRPRCPWAPAALEREAGLSGRAPFRLSSGLSSATPRSQDSSLFTGLSVPGCAPSGLSVGRPCSGGPGVSSAEPRMFCAAAGTQPAGQGGD